MTGHVSSKERRLEGGGSQTQEGLHDDRHTATTFELRSWFVCRITGTFQLTVEPVIILQITVQCMTQELQLVCIPSAIPNLERPRQQKPREGDKAFP